YAFNLIRFGQADRLVTGGVDSTITPGIMHGFSIMRVISTARNESPEPRSRGAPIYAELLGYASTCDAYHMVRLDPSGEEPARAMALALEDGGVAQDEVGYI